MAWFFGQSLLFVALAFLLGLAIGWLLWGRTSKPTTDQPGVAERPESASVIATEPESVIETEPESVIATEPEAERGPEQVDAQPEPVTTEQVAEPEPKPATEPEPVVAEPVVAEPVVAEPVVAEPVVAEPVVAEPVVAEPVVAEPVVAEPVVQPVAATVVVAEQEPEPAAQADPVTAPVPARKPDNLQRIEGIGPKISAVLVAAGIQTYEQLALADQSTLTGALRQGGLRVAPSLTTWSAQAALLAKGDEAGFAALIGELVAGRRGR